MTKQVSDCKNCQKYKLCFTLSSNTGKPECLGFIACQPVPETEGIKLPLFFDNLAGNEDYRRWYEIEANRQHKLLMEAALKKRTEEIFEKMENLFGKPEPVDIYISLKAGYGVKE